MAEIRLQYNDNVRFVLQHDAISSMVLNQEPEGWKEDELEIVRNEKYHGVFTQFTNGLKFYKGAKDFIKHAYTIGGLNANLYLIKYKLKEKNGDIRWSLDYIGLADYETLKEENGCVTINFNSNDLEVLIRAHESDTFELEREDSIDSKPISKLPNRQVYVEGRTLITRGQSDVLNPGEWSEVMTAHNPYTIPTTIVSQGHERHSSVDLFAVDTDDPMAWPSNMFFVDAVAEGEIIDIDIDWDLAFKSTRSTTDVVVKAYFKEFKFENNTYVETYSEEIATANIDEITYTGKGSYSARIDHTYGYMILFKMEGDYMEALMRSKINVSKQIININVKAFYDGSFHRFIFVDDAMSRLMEILTGSKDKFYSKLFGRKTRYVEGRGRSNRSVTPYSKDGELGFTGLISGFWWRRFDSLSDKYKSMQTSLKDTIDSLQAVFNVGIAIETRDMNQRLRIEDLKYFYQDTVAVRLPIQVTDIKREVDGSLFFSGTELGYAKGGDYRDEIGLDEPNTKTSTVTPIRKTTNKYSKISRIRSDDYGSELLRRKPQIDFPDEDVSGDEDNWFLDLKETEGTNYGQKTWSDRLQEAPEGILAPESYRSMIFTPLRMLLRHGWIIRAGMEQSINMTKYIKYISSGANKKLKMWFKGEDKPLAEDDDIRVDELERPRFLPETITFRHPIDDDVMEEILGSTTVDVNGEPEDVPNVYFKIEFINEKNEKETGYLLELKPKNSGEFKLIKANENLIF